jgi:glyoxylase-like metal-dependent hydrolase (beta-lactamase superfamily II)
VSVGAKGLGEASSALERAAADGVHCLAIPTPFAVGRVNCYLVEDEPLTLIDAGPNSGTSLIALEAELAEHGRRVEDLQRIVVTHQHIDHIGLVDILAKRSGAEVCALAVLAPWLADYKRQMIADDRFAAAVMLRNGIPEDVVHALRTVSAGFRAWGAAAHVDHPLEDGGPLEFADRRWRVLHRPGHSPSDTLFYDERSRVLLGGDHLIGHISSNPLISLPLRCASSPGGDAEQSTQPGKDVEGAQLLELARARPRALVTYLDSLHSTREMQVEAVLAGHGEPVEDHRELIDKRFGMHERRARRLHTLIAERPRNAYELAQEMWGDVAVTQAYLTLSEVLGHTDLLIERGEVRELERDGIAYFEAC